MYLFRSVCFDVAQHHSIMPYNAGLIGTLILTKSRMKRFSKQNLLSMRLLIHSSSLSDLKEIGCKFS